MSSTFMIKNIIYFYNKSIIKVFLIFMTITNLLYENKNFIYIIVIRY